MLKTVKGYFITTGILILMACLVGPAFAGHKSNSEADQLMKELDKLEANLKAMADHKAEARQEQENHLANKQADLKKKLQHVAKISQNQDIDEQQLVDLLTEVNVLREEIKLLRGPGEAAPSEQLVSSGEQDLVLAFGGPTGSDEETGIEGLEISGFFDVVNTVQTSAEDKNQFGLGQAEIDLGAALHKNVSVEVAVAYLPDEGLFELGAALIDIHFLDCCSDDADESHLRSTGINHTGIVAGQFDVPFGIDYQVVASPDRKLVHAPLVVDRTHADWNDMGLMLGLSAGVGNLVIYGVNGFESSAEVIDEVASLAAGEDVFEEIDTSPSNAVGVRLGITPIAGLEIGGSFANGWNLSGRPEMTLVGADLQYSLFNFDFKGEYISHTVNRSIAKETNTGWYFQSTYNFSRAFLAARYGSFQPDDSKSVGQITLGAGYEIVEAVEVRLETLVNSHSDENVNTLQLVASF